jgi:hypothetical protein
VYLVPALVRATIHRYDLSCPSSLHQEMHLVRKRVQGKKHPRKMVDKGSIDSVGRHMAPLELG